MSALCLLSSPPLRYNEDENKFDFKTAEEVIEVYNIYIVYDLNT